MPPERRSTWWSITGHVARCCCSPGSWARSTRALRWRSTSSLTNPETTTTGSARSHLEQTLDLRVELPADRESRLTPLRSEEAGHRVVRQVHPIRSLVHEDRDRCVCRYVRNRPGHRLHDERITHKKAEDLGTLPSSFLAQDFAGVETTEFQRKRPRFHQEAASRVSYRNDLN